MECYSKRVRDELGRAGGGAWADLMLKAKSYGDALVDLGQGKPDFHGSEVARRTAASYCMGDLDGGVCNQYCQVQGGSELIDNLVAFYKHHFNTSDLSKENVIITAGATQALMSVFLTLLQEGDEAIVIEPYFPWYPSAARLCQATPIFVRTGVEDDFWPSISAIEEKISEKTKLLIFSNPSNPAGRVLNKDELKDLINLCKKHNIFLVSDEAYEGQSWRDGSGHIKTATVASELSSSDILITLGTASKLCSLTGWRVGWIIAPTKIAAGCKLIHSHETFCAPTVLQRGIAESISLENGDIMEHMEEATVLMEKNSRLLCDALEQSLGLTVFRPQGGYFVIADVSSFICPGEKGASDKSSTSGCTDIEFVDWMLNDCKVFGMPGNIFFSMDGQTCATTPYVRFSICKSESLVQEAIRRIVETAAKL